MESGETPWPADGVTCDGFVGAPGNGGNIPRSPLAGDPSVMPQDGESGGERPEASQGKFLLPADAPDLRDWRHPRVGWGLVAAEPEGFSPAALAAGDDLPEAIRALLSERPDAPILRYRPKFKTSLRETHLRDWKRQTEVCLDRPGTGIGPGELPAYLLLLGSPEELPWELQFDLNVGSFVGRLDLDREGLENYVDALLRDFVDGSGGVDDDRERRRAARRSLVWAVDHGGGDITSLLRRTVALELHAAMDADEDLDALLLDGRRDRASAADLFAGLADHDPGFVVTTSHGDTSSPTEDLACRLGLPVDQDFRTLDPGELLARWQPRGAVWYAHGCSTAGSCGSSLYRDLFPADSVVGEVLANMEAVGSVQGPLPRALLGASRPARAVIGQVEPTFDWTLRHRNSRRALTRPLVEALYEGLFRGEPLGHALRAWYRGIGRLYSLRDRARAAARYGEMDPGTLLYPLLAARDLKSTVLLGDPTVRLPVGPETTGRCRRLAPGGGGVRRGNPS